MDIGGLQVELPITEEEEGLVGEESGACAPSSGEISGILETMLVEVNVDFPMHRPQKSAIADFDGSMAACARWLLFSRTSQRRDHRFLEDHP